MPEQTTIRADQIEGLPTLIREQVRETLREEMKGVPEDMDQLRRSPAGAMIRLESKVEALDEKVDQRFDALKSEMDQRFEAVDQRFEALQGEMNQGFEAIAQRFEAIAQRFEAVNQRFDDLKEYVTHRFTVVQWVLALLLSSQLIILGKLFVLK